MILAGCILIVSAAVLFLFGGLIDLGRTPLCLDMLELAMWLCLAVGFSLFLLGSVL